VGTEHLRERGNALPFPPRHGEHNEKVYGEIGHDAAAVAELKSRGVV
jgi:hypothetical protein